MEKIIFKRDEVSKELIAVIKNIPGEIGDGCSMKIKDSLLQQVDQNPIKCRTSRVGNKYYRVDEKITLFRVRANKVTIVDTESVKEISKVPFNYNSHKKNGEYRYDVVRQVNGTDGKKHKLTVSKIEWDLALGIIPGMERSMKYSYDKKEVHHEKMVCDNRKCSTINLTSEEHRKKHKNEKGQQGAGASHQVIVVINTMEELKAFLDYIRAY